MQNHRIEVDAAIHRLRWKYNKLPKPLADKYNDALSHVLWYSLPVVYPDYMAEGRKIRQARSARHQKKKRTNKYLSEMAEAYDDLFFVTLTFTDERLSNTDETTRRRYARAWLTENCRDYYANVDYGKENGREHFHAVCALKRDQKPTEWRCGFSKIRKITKFDEYGQHRLSSYLLKLTNHANKLTTGSCFHPRGKFKEDIDNLPF